MNTLKQDVIIIIYNKVYKLYMNDVLKELKETQNKIKNVIDYLYLHKIIIENGFNSGWRIGGVKFDNPHNLPTNITKLHLEDKIYHEYGRNKGKLCRTKHFIVNIKKYGNTWLDIWKCVEELFNNKNDYDNKFFIGFEPLNENTLNCIFSNY
jgi:predicted RNA-binding protein